MAGNAPIDVVARAVFEWGATLDLLADHQPFAIAGGEWVIWVLAILGFVGALVGVSAAAGRPHDGVRMDAELPWGLWGRRVRPVSLAVLLATSTIAYALLTVSVDDPGGAASVVPFPWPAIALGGIAIGSVVSLVVGWVMRSEAGMRLGLALAASLWAARAVYLGLEHGWGSQTALLSWCWALVAGGAHLLSVVESRHVGRGRG